MSGCPCRSYKVWEQQGEICRCQMVGKRKGEGERECRGVETLEGEMATLE